MTIQTGLLKASGGVIAIGLLVLFALGADAQDMKKAAKKTPSACQGLSETACKANDRCTWIAAIKTKAGQARRAHCRSKPTKKKK
jgi:hypothetical protein